MAFANIREVIRSVELGRMHLSFIHKTSVPTPGTQRWADCSMGAGTPIYNAYVGAQYEATPLIGQKNQGVYLGPAPNAGQNKHLLQVSLASPQTTSGPPYTVVIGDYLMFYPLIDGDSTDLQVLDNTAALPRYADGNGVQLMMVVTTPMSTSGSVKIDVTTSDDVDVSLTVQTTVSSTVGVIAQTSVQNVTLSSTPFVELPQCKGIKRVNSVTNLTGLGGFYALVLVKPLATMMLREPLTMTEYSLLHHKAGMPRIYDGAYINFLLQSSAAGSPGVIRGEFDFVWG